MLQKHPYMTFVCSLLVLLPLAVPALAGPQVDPATAQAARLAFSGNDLVGKDGPLAKMGWELTLLAEEYRAFEARGAAPVQAFQSSNALLRIQDGRVLVMIVPAGGSRQVADELNALGMRVEGITDHMISGYLPISAIATVAGMSDVRFASPDSWEAQIGAVTSQADAAMRADDARAALGFDGAGVTIGVLSDSYNFLGGAAADVASGDLPGAGNPNGFTTPVNVLLDSGVTDEGRGMLQVIHDVAPGAALAFATADGGQAAFAGNITALRTVAGADIVVDDIIYYAEPMFQDGVVAQAADACNAAGAPYFSAALNQDRNGYQVPFRNGPSFAMGAFPSVGGAPPFMGGIAHDFDPGMGTDAMQSFSLPDSGVIRMSFQWDQPFASVSGAPGSASDLDVYILDATASNVVWGSIDNNVTGDAVETFSFRNLTGGPAMFNIMLVLRTGPAPGTMKYILFNFPGTVNEWATQSGTIFGHPNALGAVATGAAPYFSTPEFGVDPAIIEDFSSSGTTPILFTVAGNPTFDGRTQKPEITAVDGVNTTFFGRDIEPDGFPNFFGTSAAAPNAAAVAALMLESVPGATPAQILSALQSSALDMGAPGFDNTTGAGLIQAPGALDAIDPCILGCPGDITVGNDPGECTAVVLFMYAVSGNCGPVTSVPPSGSAFPVGTTTVQLTAFSGETCSFDLTVYDIEPPQLTCPDDITVECSAAGGTPRTDPQLASFFNAVSATDNCGSVNITDNAPTLFPVGTTPVIFLAEDDAGNAATCTVNVTVEDTTPPDIMVEVTPDCLWPPNHKLATIEATVTVTDVCDPNPTFVLEWIGSNEPANDKGDGNTEVDITDADLGTDDTVFSLRSERQGGGDGRVYTIIYEAVDTHGNAAYDTVTVRVPHDRGGGAICATGFALTGTGLDEAAPSYTLVIPSTDGFDATSVIPVQAYVGNLLKVVKPQYHILTEVTGDGRPDLVLMYDGESVRRAATVSSDLAADPTKVKANPKPIKVGLHYRTVDGTDYLVRDILGLGEPIAITALLPWGMGNDPGAPEDPGDTGTDPTTAQEPGTLVLPASGPVVIEVFNVLGQRVRTLVNEDLTAGTHRITWDGRDGAGRIMPSGMYFYRIQAPGLREVKKVFVVR